MAASHTKRRFRTRAAAQMCRGDRRRRPRGLAGLPQRRPRGRCVVVAARCMMTSRRKRQVVGAEPQVPARRASRARLPSSVEYTSVSEGSSTRDHPRRCRGAGRRRRGGGGRGALAGGCGGDGGDGGGGGGGGGGLVDESGRRRTAGLVAAGRPVLSATRGYPDSHRQLHRQCRSVVPPAEFSPHAHPSLQCPDLSYIPSRVGRRPRRQRREKEREIARCMGIANQPTARTKDARTEATPGGHRQEARTSAARALFGARGTSRGGARSALLELFALNSFSVAAAQVALGRVARLPSTASCSMPPKAVTGAGLPRPQSRCSRGRRQRAAPTRIAGKRAGEEEGRASRSQRRGRRGRRGARGAATAAAAATAARPAAARQAEAARLQTLLRTPSPSTARAAGADPAARGGAAALDLHGRHPHGALGARAPGQPRPHLADVAARRALGAVEDEPPEPPRTAPPAARPPRAAPPAPATASPRRLSVSTAAPAAARAPPPPAAHHRRRAAARRGRGGGARRSRKLWTSRITASRRGGGRRSRWRSARRPTRTSPASPRKTPCRRSSSISTTSPAALWTHAGAFPSRRSRAARRRRRRRRRHFRRPRSTTSSAAARATRCRPAPSPRGPRSRCPRPPNRARRRRRRPPSCLTRRQRGGARGGGGGGGGGGDGERRRRRRRRAAA